jgi:hypothetical protein
LQAAVAQSGVFDKLQKTFDTAVKEPRDPIDAYESPEESRVADKGFRKAFPNYP